MASPVDTSVKFYRDDFPGAPVHSNVAGAAISLFEACLCTGFGTRTATSVVVAGGVATVTLASDVKNGNLLYSVVEVSGVTGPMTDLNGEQRVTAASATTLQFATAVADGTAAGTITVKTAPAGWEKVYTGTNKAVFRSLSPESLGMHLWVSDTGTTYVKVRGFEAMTDVDTGTGAFPTALQSAAGGSWIKAYSSGARWDVFADARAFIYSPVPSSGSTPAQIGQTQYFFGDFLPFKSGDAFACTLFSSAADASSSSIQYGGALFGGQGAAQGMCSFPRSYTGLGSALTAYGNPVSGSLTTQSGIDNYFGVFPTPTDGGLRLAHMNLSEVASLVSATTVLRGVLPGVFYSPQNNLGASFQRGDTIMKDGRRLYVVAVSTDATNTGTAGGRGFVDITGPWR